MKIFLISAAFAIVMAASSCITQQKCLERFPPNDFDSVLTVVTFKDTIIYDTVIIPGKGVTLHDTIPCPDINYHKEVSKNGIKQTVTIVNGVLDAACEADALKEVIARLVKEKSTLVKQLTIRTLQPVKVNELTKFQGFQIVCGWLFWICFLIGVIYIILRVYFKK
ncbi:MAG: hypothetical protein V4549_07475 [Bacteroidota bacterium]